MKKFLVLSILILSSAYSQAQISWTRSNITIRGDSLKTFTVYDSLKGVVAISRKDSLIVIDSLAAIKTLIGVSKYQFERAQKQSEKYWALLDVLRYVKTDGNIEKEKKFYAALAKYRKLKTSN